MLYLIGLGLNENSLSEEALEILKRCKRVYVETYTVDYPYSLGIIKEKVGKKYHPADREKVESLELVDEAKKMDIALLVYGSPLTATTHISLLQEAKRLKVKYKIFYNASILDAVAETGLQLYKFGKITSMPAWKKSYEPTSFMEIVKQNQSIKAHSLILCDIGLEFHEAIRQLEVSAEEYEIELKKLVVCQALGTKKAKIFYKDLEDLKEFDGVRNPFCIIIPSKMHFVEKEVLEAYK